MIIEWLGNENFQIKTKGIIIKIGEKKLLGDLEINGPGEYEVGGAQMEVIDGVISVYAEAMTIGHIKKGKVLSDDDLQKLNGIDILLIGVGGGEFTENKIAHDVIAQIDPAVVIPMGKDIGGFAKTDSQNAQDELKISKGELPSEERQMVILNASTK